MWTGLGESERDAGASWALQSREQVPPYGDRKGSCRRKTPDSNSRASGRKQKNKEPHSILLPSSNPAK